MRIDIEAAEIARVVEHVEALCPDDEALLADMLEGETGLHELCSKIINMIEEEQGNIAALKSQVATRNERKKRSEMRQKAYRNAIMRLMDAGKQKKLTLPEATISRGIVKPKRVVSDIEALPVEFITFTRKANMEAIKRFDGEIAGVVMDNGGDKLTVRMK